MIQYEGYEAEKPPQKKNEVPPPERALFPYFFHIEDWYGDDIYQTLFPSHYKMKSFLIQLLFFTVIIILMRISVGFA